MTTVHYSRMSFSFCTGICVYYILKKQNKQPAVLVGLHVNRSSVWKARYITEECDTEKQWSVNKLQVGPTPLWTRVSTVLCNRPVSRYDICNWLITICEVLTWLWSVYAYFLCLCLCGHTAVELLLFVAQLYKRLICSGNGTSKICSFTSLHWRNFNTQRLSLCVCMSHFLLAFNLHRNRCSSVFAQKAGWMEWGLGLQCVAWSGRISLSLPPPLHQPVNHCQPTTRGC